MVTLKDKDYKFFRAPTQVRFVDPYGDNLCWMSGIAYKDEIICAECGGVIEINDIYNDEDIMAYTSQPIKLLGDWVDFNDYITY